MIAFPCFLIALWTNSPHPLGGMQSLSSQKMALTLLYTALHPVRKSPQTENKICSEWCLVSTTGLLSYGVLPVGSRQAGRFTTSWLSHTLSFPVCSPSGHLCLQKIVPLRNKDPFQFLTCKREINFTFPQPHYLLNCLLCPLSSKDCLWISRQPF